MRRGIEPIIATVILVAVALIIAVAVVGYLMGLFGGLTGGTPQISITSVRATLAGSDLNVEIYVNNAGAGSDKLVRAEVIYPGGSRDTTFEDKTITGNHKGWETLTIGNVQVSPGDTVVLKLYFERSGTYTINVVVSPSSTTQAT
ncbi:MAG: archaellin/type IV pilin N-terminal domain-containing protein, partial [Desulfurococcaceae archaeon]